MIKPTRDRVLATLRNDTTPRSSGYLSGYLCLSERTVRRALRVLQTEHRVERDVTGPYPVYRTTPRYVLATTGDDLAAALVPLPKDALIELYLQALATSHGHCDEAVSLFKLGADARSVLAARGDRVPPTLSEA